MAVSSMTRAGLAVLSVPMSLMERLRATETDAEDLSALGPQIEGVDCAITMRELRPDIWKMSLRTGARGERHRGLPAAGRRRPRRGRRLHGGGPLGPGQGADLGRGGPGGAGLPDRQLNNSPYF